MKICVAHPGFLISIYLYMITECCSLWYTCPWVAGSRHADDPLARIPGPKEGSKVLFLLQRHPGLVVVRGEREDVHVGGRPVEGDTRMGAREREGSLIINTICIDTCKKGENSLTCITVISTTQKWKN